jgi:hypothetical protein
VKAGDIVRFAGSVDKNRTGLLVSCGDFSEGWWTILDCDGEMVVWPEVQLEVVDEV